MSLPVARRPRAAAAASSRARSFAPSQRSPVGFDRGARARRTELLAEAKISETHVPASIEEHVVGLQVPVDVPQIVDALHSESGFKMNDTNGYHTKSIR